MRVFISTDHAGHYPVPRASVVFANDMPEAIALLGKALTDIGLGGEHFSLTELAPDAPCAYVLSDGNY